MEFVSRLIGTIFHSRSQGEMDSESSGASSSEVVEGEKDSDEDEVKSVSAEASASEESASLHSDFKSDDEPSSTPSIADSANSSHSDKASVPDVPEEPKPGKQRGIHSVDYVRDPRLRSNRFGRRRPNLFKKAKELASLTGAKIAVVVISEKGSMHTYASHGIQAERTISSTHGEPHVLRISTDYRRLLDWDVADEVGEPFNSALDSDYESTSLDHDTSNVDQSTQLPPEPIQQIPIESLMGMRMQLLPHPVSMPNITTRMSRLKRARSRSKHSRKHTSRGKKRQKKHHAPSKPTQDFVLHD